MPAAAYTLRVGDTSAQDISLSTSGVIVTSYPMQSPTIQQQVLSQLGDGDGLSIPSFENVTESIELHISDTTSALVAAKVRAIEAILDLARQDTYGSLDGRVYLVAELEHDTEIWRSQILTARLVLPQGTDEIWKKYTTATLIITRRFYFEVAQIRTVELTSGPTPTPTAGYVNIYNADDTHATNRNWFQIAAAQVVGSIPAPAKISVKNASGSTRAATSLFLGNYVFNNPTTVDPIFRVEDVAGTLTAGTTEGSIAYWHLIGGNLTDAFKGQIGRLVAVFTDRPLGTTLVRAAMDYRGPAPILNLALGEQALNAASDYAMDLGGIPIPPGQNWANVGDRLYLSVMAKTPTGTDTITFDWVQVFPGGAGRYRVLRGIYDSLTLNATNEFVDDGVNGGSWLRDNVNSVNLPLYKPLFDPIYLWPGRINRLRALINSGNNPFEAGQLWQVKVEYRPRRLTL